MTRQERIEETVAFLARVPADILQRVKGRLAIPAWQLAVVQGETLDGYIVWVATKLMRGSDDE